MKRLPWILIFVFTIAGASSVWADDPELVFVEPARISGYDLYGDGGLWWSAPGVCDGEFKREAVIRFRRADFKTSWTKNLTEGCDILQTQSSNAVRDSFYIYYFSERKLMRQTGYFENWPAVEIQLPPGMAILPPGQPGAHLMINDDTLYWGRYLTGANQINRIQLLSIKTDGTDGKVIGDVFGVGAPIRQMEMFKVNTLGNATFHYLVILLENGALYRYALETGSVKLIMSGVTEFALHNQSVFLGGLRRHIFATESTFNPGRFATPGRLWRIDAIDLNDKEVLYEADLQNQIVSVAVDPGTSTFLSPRNIYIAEASLDCTGIFCGLGNVSIKRNTIPASNKAAWAENVIVNDNGGYRLRSNGEWLYFFSVDKMFRISTDAEPIQFDLEAHGLEVVQAVQNMDHSVFLVAGKDTVVRGYAYVPLSNTDDVQFFPDAVLEISKDGKPLKSEVYSSNNARITGSLDFSVLRSSEKRSFQFEVGELPAGELTFTMTVNPECQSLGNRGGCLCEQHGKPHSGSPGWQRALPCHGLSSYRAGDLPHVEQESSRYRPPC